MIVLFLKYRLCMEYTINRPNRTIVEQEYRFKIPRSGCGFLYCSFILLLLLLEFHTETCRI